MSETSEVTTPFIKAVNGLPGCKARRQHSGKGKGLKGGWVYFGEKGWPDIWVGVRGQTLFFETKSGDGKLSEDQRKTHQELRDCGFDVHVIDNVPDGLKVVREALNRRQ